MINKKLIGTNAKYIKFISIFSALFIASFFLPWLSVGSEKTLSGVQILFGGINWAGTGNAVLMTVLLAVPMVLSFISLVLTLFVKRKLSLRIATISYSICAVLAVVYLFSFKKCIDASGDFSKALLVSNLGVGYWIELVLSFVCLTFSMMSAKIDTGYILLTVISVVWLFPVVYIILISFRGEQGFYSPNFFPKSFTFDNYIKVITDTSTFYYVRWFLNTLKVAVLSCLLSTIIILSTAFVLSRIRFNGRKKLMNVMLILGMFPGFMSMIAVYYIIKGMGLAQTHAALVLCYGGGAALGYYIVKGFFDTIPRAMDEAATIDGASKWTIFTRITIPLSKPIIIYSVLTSFISPWCDYIFSSIILGDSYENYTVALGLYTMLQDDYINTWFTSFAAGAVIVSLPIAILFICLQKYYVEGLSGSVKG
ncbi:MAG: sugar ABC transporter permease [Ruminococcus sp.]